VTAGREGRLRLWDPESAECLEVVDTEGRIVFRFGVSADGRTVLIHAQGRGLFRLEVAGDSPTPDAGAEADLRSRARVLADRLRRELPKARAELEIPPESMDQGVVGFAQSAGGAYVATSSLLSWNRTRIEILDGKQGVLLAHLGIAPPLWSMQYSPDDSSGDLLLATGGADLRVWHLPTLLEPSAAFVGAFVCGALSPDGRLAALADPSDNVSLLEVATAKSIASTRPGVGRIRALTFEPAGTSIAIAGETRQVVLWAPWSLAKAATDPLPITNSGVVRSLAFQPGGRLLAVGSFKRIVVWDLHSGREIRSDTGHGSVRCLAYSPSGETLWAGHEDGAIERLDARGGSPRLLRDFDGDAATVLCPTADGRGIAAGFADGDVSILDGARGTERFTRRGHGAAVAALAISPDGKVIASGDARSELRFWEVEAGILRLRLDCEGGAIVDLRFGVDGKTLVLADRTGHLRTLHASDRLSPEEVLRDSGPPTIDARGGAVSEGLGSTADALRWTLLDVVELDTSAGCEGLAWEDLDGDGDLDLVLALPDSQRVLLGDGRGRLADASSSLALWRPDFKSVLPGDLDGDGDIDLYLGNRSGPNRLLDNRGGGSFVEATAPGLAAIGQGPTAAAADYDGDGDLDLFVGSGASESHLLRNDRSAGFVEVVSDRPEIRGRARGAAWGDFDGDGRPDLFIASRSGPDRLLQNRAGAEFVAAIGPSEFSSRASRGGVWGDYDNDGDLDLYAWSQSQPNRLYRNECDGRFTDVSEGLLGDRGDTKAAAWGDYDNDGDLDIFIGNNDADSRLLRNEGVDSKLAFLDVTAAPLSYAGSAYALAWADIDGDGDLDLTVSDWDNAVQIFRNDGENGNHWLEVRLRGESSNRFGVGARVRIVAGAKSQIREITAGSGTSTQPLIAHFGLGRAERADLLEVRWPSGKVEILEAVAADRLLVIREGDAGAAVR
jgi:WD40 repeat protein